MFLPGNYDEARTYGKLFHEIVKHGHLPADEFPLRVAILYKYRK